MTIEELAKQARTIWGDKRMTLPEIAVVIGVVYGDICRQTRDLQERGALDDDALKKELGNLIFSAIRWCEELGYDPHDCVEIAQQAQTRYATSLKTASDNTPS